MCLKEPLSESSGEKQSPSCSVIVPAPPRLGLDLAGATAVPGGDSSQWLDCLERGWGRFPLQATVSPQSHPPPRNDQNYKLR